MQALQPPDPSQLFSLWRLNCFGLDQLAAAHDRPIELRGETLSVHGGDPYGGKLGVLERLDALAHFIRDPHSLEIHYVLHSLVRLTFEYRVCLLTTEIGSPFTGGGAYQIDHPVTTVTLSRTAGW